MARGSCVRIRAVKRAREKSRQGRYLLNKMPTHSLKSLRSNRTQCGLLRALAENDSSYLFAGISQANFALFCFALFTPVGQLKELTCF